MQFHKTNNIFCEELRYTIVTTRLLNCSIRIDMKRLSGVAYLAEVEFQFPTSPWVKGHRQNGELVVAATARTAFSSDFSSLHAFACINKQ